MLFLIFVILTPTAILAEEVPQLTPETVAIKISLCGRQSAHIAKQIESLWVGQIRIWHRDRSGAPVGGDPASQPVRVVPGSGFEAPEPAPSNSAAEDEPVEVTISRSKSPASAQHIEDAQAAGQPKVVTLDRSGTQGAARAAARGRAATSRIPTAPGMDRDEYPPKCCAEGGNGASGRSIPSSDNRSAGAQLGNQIRTLPDGTKIRIKTGP
jgi:hypothetical protein